VVETPPKNSSHSKDRYVSRIIWLGLKLLILGEGHLHRVLTTYVVYYNTARPHQGIKQQCPVRLLGAARDGPIERQDILGGVLHNYYRRAA